jgi:protein tyrosine/serine phosphatase
MNNRAGFVAVCRNKATGNDEVSVCDDELQSRTGRREKL